MKELKLWEQRVQSHIYAMCNQAKNEAVVPDRSQRIGKKGGSERKRQQRRRRREQEREKYGIERRAGERGEGGLRCGENGIEGAEKVGLENGEGKEKQEEEEAENSKRKKRINLLSPDSRKWWSR